MLLTHTDSINKVADGFKAVAFSGSIIAGQALVSEFSLLIVNWHHVNISLA